MTQPHQDQINDQDTLWKVSDELWVRLVPIFVIDKPRKKNGRPTRDVRAIFNGLIWLARTGSQWSHLPHRYGPKSTLHERCSAWVENDQELGIDWEGPATDGSRVTAQLGTRGTDAAEATGSHSTDRGQAGANAL